MGMAVTLVSMMGHRRPGTPEHSRMATGANHLGGSAARLARIDSQG